MFLEINMFNEVYVYMDVDRVQDRYLDVETCNVYMKYYIIHYTSN